MQQYGAGNAYNAGSTMDQIARNSWLNTLSEEDKMRAMNQMGYWSGGAPVKTPRIPAPPLKGYDTPGSYQIQLPNGAYAGMVNVPEQGQPVWDPLRARPTNRFPTLPGGPGGWGGGNPSPNGPPGGNRPGNRPGHGNNQRPNPRPVQGPGGMPNQGIPGGPGGMPSGSFLPMTPEYEAQRRSIEDQYAASLADLVQQRSLIPGMINMFGAREGTDIANETNLFNENMIGRGIYNSGIRPQEEARLITTPHGRAQQDFQLQIEDLYNQLAQAEAGAGLGYNQALTEALLGRGQQLAAQPPLSLPGQYPERPNRNRPRRNRNRRRR